MDKDIDIYAWWIDCNRSGDQEENMEPVAFALESGNHNSQDGKQGVGAVQSNQVQCTKVVRDGQIFILRGDKTYTLQGQEIR